MIINNLCFQLNKGTWAYNRVIHIYYKVRVINPNYISFLIGLKISYKLVLKFNLIK